MERGISSINAKISGHPLSVNLQSNLVGIIICLVIIGLSYSANLKSLVTIWSNEPNYSHGFLVIPIALVICHRRLSDLKKPLSASTPSWWHWLLLMCVLTFRAFAYEYNFQWLENVTLLPALLVLTLIAGGWLLLETIWPALIFLIFMFPLPPSINTLIAAPLQSIATLGSLFLLQLTGLWVRAEGNVLILRTPHGPTPLEVAQACNGLSMLMTLAATVTATLILINLPRWQKIIIILSAVPIALISNITRIVATGWFYYLLEGENAKHYAHDWSGYLMMPLALLLTGLEIAILTWLGGSADNKDDESRPISPLLTMRSS